MKDVSFTQSKPSAFGSSSLPFLGLCAVTTVLLCLVWAWADVGPESSWPGSPWRIGLVGLSSNAGAAFVLRTHHKARALMAMLIPVVAASGFIAWSQRAEMMYDRSRLSAVVESAAFFVVVLVLAAAGFVLLVLAEKLITRAQHAA